METNTGVTTELVIVAVLVVSAIIWYVVAKNRVDKF